MFITQSSPLRLHFKAHSYLISLKEKLGIHRQGRVVTNWQSHRQFSTKFNYSDWESQEKNSRSHFWEAAAVLHAKIWVKFHTNNTPQNWHLRKIGWGLHRVLSQQAYGRLISLDWSEHVAKSRSVIDRPISASCEMWNLPTLKNKCKIWKSLPMQKLKPLAYLE